MPLISLVRFLTTLLSLAILATAAYLLWRWYDGTDVRDAEGVVHNVREGWPLWLGLALVAFSFLGKFLMLPLLARPDREPLPVDHGAGKQVQGPSGATLYVDSAGPADGPPVILTHGWSLDSTVWGYARRSLGQRFRLILWDLPGLGRSQPTPGNAIDLERFAADLRTVLAEAGGRPAVLVGHSIGGMTIQTLARNHPELFGREVIGVVLVNTTYTNPLRTMILPRLMQALRRPLIEPLMYLTILLHPLAWLSNWQSYLSGTSHLANRIAFGPHVTRAQLDHVTLLATRNPPAQVSRGNLAMFRWDATGALANVGVPVLVLAGSKDIVTKPEASRDIAATSPRARLQVIDDANHMGFFERADVYNQAIAEFVESVQPNPTQQALDGQQAADGRVADPAVTRIIPSA